MDLQQQKDLILGPQTPITDSWFDQTFITKARLHGEACPAEPPPKPIEPDPKDFGAPDALDEAAYGAAIAKWKLAVQLWADGPLNEFVLLNYYDLPLVLYIAHRRTNDPVFLTLARKCADSWWKHPTWIGEGEIRPWIPDGAASPPPRHAGLGGLKLRALDGRPEMWDWIVNYELAHLDIWCKLRINDAQLWYGPREVAFTLQYAAWIASALPDSYPNASRIKAQLIADLENLVVNYTGRLQYPDGSWRDSSEWLDNVLAVLSHDAPAQTTQLRVQPLHFPVAAGQKVEFAQGGVTRTTKPQAAGSVVIDVEPLPIARAANSILYVDDGTMILSMQPFIVGLLVSALVDVHQVLVDGPARGNVKGQILKACRHLYSDGPYAKDLIEQKSGRRVRGFHYFYHGGTTLNPTKYEKGSMVAPWTDLEGWWLAGARQAISTILPSFGYAYKISGDEFFKTAGDEMFDSAYNGTDGERALMESSAKNFNQHARRAASYLAWAGAVMVPNPAPQPSDPTPTQPVPSTPSPDGTKATSIVDKDGGVWTIGPNKETLREGKQQGGGQGTIYKYLDKTVYVLGDIAMPESEKNWYKWSGSSWPSVGKTEPGIIVQPPPQFPPEPPLPPAPAPCKMTVSELTLPSWGSGVINVTLENMTGPTEVKAVSSSGQVSVSPGLKKVSGTSAVIPFQVSVKKKGGEITFSSNCGSQTVMVNVK